MESQGGDYKAVHESNTTLPFYLMTCIIFAPIFFPAVTT